MKTQSKLRWAVIGNGNWGLYYGRTDGHNTEGKRWRSGDTLLILDCRHVCRWYGKKGGITSLAVFGICGPNAANSRIAAPAPESEIGDVRAVHYCTAVAVASIGAVTWE
jgi:hypothetical protein